MIEVVIRDRDRRPIETVLLRVLNPRPSLIAWGSRMFALEPDGTYLEMPCVQVYTPREHAAMGTGGG